MTIVKIKTQEMSKMTDKELLAKLKANAAAISADGDDLESRIERLETEITALGEDGG